MKHGERRALAGGPVGERHFHGGSLKREPGQRLRLTRGTLAAVPHQDRHIGTRQCGRWSMTGNAAARAIRALWNRTVLRWNSGMADLFAADADFVSIEGARLKSRTAVRDWHAWLFSGATPSNPTPTEHPRVRGRTASVRGAASAAGDHPRVRGENRTPQRRRGTGRGPTGVLVRLRHWWPPRTEGFLPDTARGVL